MKKIAAIFLSLSLVSITIFAFADSPVFPSKNTDAEIVFNDFVWYEDYHCIFEHAKELGYGRSNSYFSRSLAGTPHWEYLRHHITTFARSKEGCGGHIVFYDNLPKVAGYDCKNINMYFVWKQDSSLYDNYIDQEYKVNGSTEFYMASYSIIAQDVKAVYLDIVGKLKKKYGDDPHVMEWNSKSESSIWVNEDGALLGITYGNMTFPDEVLIVYEAPGAEEKLSAIEKAVAEKQILDAGDDMSGL